MAAGGQRKTRRPSGWRGGFTSEPGPAGDHLGATQVAKPIARDVCSRPDPEATLAVGVSGGHMSGSGTHLPCQLGADKRVALLVGNSAYKNVTRLHDPASDPKLIPKPPRTPP